jgi:elongator complex protein 6
MIVSILDALTIFHRCQGLDLEKLANKKRFIFVDGLTSLFLPAMSSKAPSTSTPSSANPRPADIAQIREDIKSSIHALQDKEEQNNPVLIIDGLDLVLATFATADPVSLSSMVLDLCENVHTTILCLASDEPFVHQQRTPLEINQASFLLSMAHMADLLISLRGLGTGCARDVSGVLRISRRCTSIHINEGGKEEDGRELLYHVSGDGVVKVFERGE